MRRAYRYLPCYAGDVSGVCSALYELGGMVVIHDPSGCNSTYNTHDECRWYDEDSMIFISGLSEMDAILGADEKLIDEIVETAESLKPKFIALVSSPVPFMNGTDFPAIARLLKERTGIDSFFVPTNGMHDYVAGAGEAFKILAERYAQKKGAAIKNSINILGLTPLDFAAEGSGESLRKYFESCGYSVLSSWTMGSDLSEIEIAVNAEVNLVVSATALKAAQELKKRFGTPFVTGLPIKGDENRLKNALERAVQRGENQMPCKERRKGEIEIVLIGEPVSLGSLGNAIAEKYSKGFRILCPLEADAQLLSSEDMFINGEEELEKAVCKAKIVIGDPMYRKCCPENVQFYGLPHMAFSGRSFRSSMRNLWELDV